MANGKEQKQEVTKEEKENFYKTQKEIFENDFIKYIALSKYGEQTDYYGKFGKDIFEQTYFKTASKAPNQTAYEALFGEAVLGNGSITKEQLKLNAQKFWGSSVGAQKVSYLAKKMGYSGPISEEYNKYLHELDEENAGKIQSSYFQYEIAGMLQKGIDEHKKGIAGGLEEILKPKKAPEGKEPGKKSEDQK
ncbi:MAG: hypothetical protein Q8Q04_01335 [archaeon]|nr:hypothetical protein [archaeon]